MDEKTPEKRKIEEVSEQPKTKRFWLNKMFLVLVYLCLVVVNIGLYWINPTWNKVWPHYMLAIVLVPALIILTVVNIKELAKTFKSGKFGLGVWLIIMFILFLISSGTIGALVMMPEEYFSYRSYGEWPDQVSYIGDIDWEYLFGVSTLASLYSAAILIASFVRYIRKELR